MTTGPAPMCLFCVHLHANGVTGCTAFPDAIPAEIMNNKTDHRQPVAGDNGIRYEAADRQMQPAIFEFFDER